MNDQPSAPPQAQNSNESAIVATVREFGAVVKTSSDNVERATRAMAAQLTSGPSIVLYFLGVGVIVVALAMKIEINGEVWARLEPGEFVAVLLLGLCLFVIGAAMPLIPQRESTKFQQKTLEQSAEVAKGAIRGTATEISLVAPSDRQQAERTEGNGVSAH